MARTKVQQATAKIGALEWILLETGGAVRHVEIQRTGILSNTDVKDGSPEVRPQEGVDYEYVPEPPHECFR